MIYSISVSTPIMTITMNMPKNKKAEMKAEPKESWLKWKSFSNLLNFCSAI